MSIARVQSKSGNSGASSVTSLTVTLNSAPTVGNIIVAAAAIMDGTAMFADNQSIDWNHNPARAGVVVGMLAIGRVLSGATGAVTVQSSGGAGGIAMVLAEYSGQNLVGDSYSAPTSGTSTSPASGSTIGTLLDAAELGIGMIAVRGIATVSSPTNSYTIVDQTASNLGVTTTDRTACLVEKFLSGTSATSFGATLNTSLLWSAKGRTVREVVAAAGGESKGRRANGGGR